MDHYQKTMNLQLTAKIKQAIQKIEGKKKQ